MNIVIQKCNECGVDNTTGDKTWTRIFGAFAGAPTISLQTLPPGQKLSENIVRPAVIDLCPTCSAKTTIAQLIALSTPKAPTAEAAAWTIHPEK